jgi:hypothetical protein
MSLALFSARRRIIATPPSADLLLQFLPPGMTFHSDTRWENPPSSPNSVVDGWSFFDSTLNVNMGTPPASDVQRQIERVEDATALYGPWIVRQRCPAFVNGEVNFGGAFGGGGTGFGTLQSLEIPAGNRRMYIGKRLRFNAQYRTHHSDEKFLYPTYWGTSPSQVPYMSLAQSSNNGGSGPLAIRIHRYNDDNPGFLNFTSTVLPLGQWFDFVADWTLNTPGNTDGKLRVWVNGEIVADIQSGLANVAGTEQLTFRTARIASTRGGGLSTRPLNPEGAVRDTDRIVLYYGAQ